MCWRSGHLTYRSRGRGDELHQRGAALWLPEQHRDRGIKCVCVVVTDKLQQPICGRREQSLRPFLSLDGLPWPPHFFTGGCFGAGPSEPERGQ